MNSRNPHTRHRTSLMVVKGLHSKIALPRKHNSFHHGGQIQNFNLCGAIYSELYRCAIPSASYISNRDVTSHNMETKGRTSHKPPKSTHVTMEHFELETGAKDDILVASLRKKIRKNKNRNAGRSKKVSCVITSIPAAVSQVPKFSNADYIVQMKQKLTQVVKTFSPMRLCDLAAVNQRHILLPLDIVMKNNTRPKKLPLLAAIKPENEKSEKERFMRANFNYNPYFLYPGRVDDEVMQKFRAPSNKYLSQAILIMKKTLVEFGSYESFEEISGGRALTRSQIYNAIKRYLSNEELVDEVQINLSDDLLSRGSLTSVKGRTVLNVRSVNLREHWAEGLLRHEIGTHYLRSCNTRCQPWNNNTVRDEMMMGPVNPTEEGLASLHSVIFREKPYLWRAALLYYTTYMASRKSFKELFTDLGMFVQSPAVRWDYCLRAKRGQVDTARPGSFCKDQVYLEGALQLLKRRKSLDFQLLFRLGKVSFEDVGRRDVIDKAQLKQTRIPWFMEDMTLYRKQLDRIAYTNGLTDSVLRIVD